MALIIGVWRAGDNDAGQGQQIVVLQHSGQTCEFLSYNQWLCDSCHLSAG
jgi:hypothetical protein